MVIRWVKITNLQGWRRSQSQRVLRPVKIFAWSPTHPGENINCKPRFWTTSKSNFFVILNFFKINIFLNYEVLKILILKYFKIELFLNFVVKKKEKSCFWSYFEVFQNQGLQSMFKPPPTITPTTNNNFLTPISQDWGVQWRNFRNKISFCFDIDLIWFDNNNNNNKQNQNQNNSIR